MGIASVSIVMSGFASTEEYLCNNLPPSMCQQCVHDQCACRNVPGTCWCHDYCERSCGQNFPTYGCPVEVISTECQSCLNNCCEVESFQYCQQQWFHPYWMEIYNDNVKGCYARDLLCVNDLIQNHLCPGVCEELYPNDEKSYQECCESSYCYLYGEPTSTQFFLEVQSITINVPSCNNARTFFKDPPPCWYLNNDSQKIDQIQINGYPELSCCFDMRNCTTNTLECSTPCSGYDLPPNYSCNMNEIVILGIHSIGGEILINGVAYQFSDCIGPGCQQMVVWYNGQKPFSAVPGIVYVNQGVPRTITISGTGSITFYAEQKCCYNCEQKPSLPSSILYPKVDIETLSIAGGPTVIKDGKILSSLTISPGIQQAMIQVENRGFFTQNDSRVRFEGLPAGVTVSVQPDTQKITAHNIGTYSAIFTVGPNVPSGTYKVTMIAYSPNGVFDTITIDFVVP